jgi:hypothetical protein
VAGLLGLTGSPFQGSSLRGRFGKTEFAKAWIGQVLVQGEVCAWFAPQHMTSHEVHRDLTKMFEPFLESSSRTPPVIRLPNGGRLDFWSRSGVSARRD